MTPAILAAMMGEIVTAVVATGGGVMEVIALLGITAGGLCRYGWDDYGDGDN